MLCNWHYDGGGEKIQPGWLCDDRTALQCYGSTGTQVLDSLGQYYSTLSSESTLGVDILLNIGIALTTKFVFWGILRHQSRSCSKILDVEVGVGLGEDEVEVVRAMGGDKETNADDYAADLQNPNVSEGGAFFCIIL